MNKALCLLLIILLAIPKPAFAWAECGHNIVALLAFDLLTKDEQAKILAILEKHPRYADDFTPPADLPNDEEQLRWRIGRMGYWPDIARKTANDRPMWHYEVGPALIVGDENKLIIAERPGKLPEDATLKTTKLYISQALPMVRKTLSDKSQPDADRAIALCWVTHLVGDAHQPNHAGSLFMEGVFMKTDGDRGANSIPLPEPKQPRGPANMHALWDQVLGNDFDLEAVRGRLAEIRKDDALTSLGKEAATKDNGLDPQTWLAESRAFSRENVYRPEVIDSLQKVARGLIEKPEPLVLSDAYQKNAEQVAKRRVTEAAYRLAAVWREALQEK
jgi:hypothetical protein